MTQVLVMFGLQLSGQILMIAGVTQFFAEPMGYSPDITYQNFVDNDNSFVLDSYENNALFLFSNIMYIMTLLAFSISKPWRKEFFTNPFFMGVLLFVLTYSLVMIVVPEARLSIF
jgi:magnesium-transporting ATPase (P-type)